jgi:hypothetical protein
MRLAVCDSVKNLYAGLVEALPLVRRCIAEGRINEGDFSHTRYNGCEIIP